LWDILLLCWLWCRRLLCWLWRCGLTDGGGLYQLSAALSAAFSFALANGVTLGTGIQFSAAMLAKITVIIYLLVAIRTYCHIYRINKLMNYQIMNYAF